MALQYIAVSGFEHRDVPPGCATSQDGMGFACHHLLVYSKERNQRRLSIPSWQWEITMCLQYTMQQNHLLEHLTAI